MELERIELRKFRSIEKCIIRSTDIWCLVGQNNSGKSAILRALNSFFNYEEEKENFIKGHHQYTQNSWPQIRLDFSGVPSDSQLASYSQENQCRVRLRYEPKKEEPFYEVYEDGWDSVDFDLVYEIKKYIHYVFIPPVRGPKELKWAEETLLRSVIEAHLEQYTSSRDNTTPKFLEATNYLEEKAFNKISDQLSDFYDLNHDFDFEIKYRKGIDYSSFLNEIEFVVNDKGVAVGLPNCGSGIQSMVIIALHRYIASLNDKTVIIGLEEPESNLHPQSQRELVNALTNYRKNGSSSQIIMTTHSTVLIDELDHTQVVLVRKVVDSKRGFKSVVSQLKDNFGSRVDLDKSKYYNFHRYRNSEFFFSKGIILVEGDSDEGVLRILMKDENIHLESHGISVMSLDGVQNIIYPYYLLKQLDIPCLYILDKDYFLPYKNGTKKKSRDNDGFLQYQAEYKDGCLIKELVDSEGDRQKLLEELDSNHTEALKTLQDYNIVCMRRNLEEDLFVSEKARNIFANIVGIDGTPSEHDLLVGRSNQIKESHYMVETVDRLPNRNLPRSFSKIKSVASNFIEYVNT